jgi:hypothetical protein
MRELWGKKDFSEAGAIRLVHAAPDKA